MSARISSLEDRLAAVDKTHDDRIRSAERERCAKIAERFLSTLKTDFARGQHSAAYNIALAIRE